jgi:AmmeMemoRadiSam system radical SAM enzyme
MATLANKLDRMTVEGELYEALPDGSLRCYACGHRCLIRPGRRGICQVRFNKDGKLWVPWGYVAALQADPIEKKPLFHVLTGSDALTFGMLGCDFHCGYCFTPDTPVVTEHGPVHIAQLYDTAERHESIPGGEMALPVSRKVYTASGHLQRLRAVFRHPYQGAMQVVTPFYLPPIRCTPDHRVFATTDPSIAPELVSAGSLTTRHYLAVPKCFDTSESRAIDLSWEMRDLKITYNARWKLPDEEREFILAESAKEVSSRQLGAALGKDASYIRHVRSKVARFGNGNTRTNGMVVDEGMLRFPNERKPGIPAALPLDEGLARLLGFYCAEGSVVEGKNRPNSWNVNFSFTPQEIGHANEVLNLLCEYFNVRASLGKRETTLTVSVSKASIALLLKTLAGQHAANKRVPRILYRASNTVIQAFLEAYVAGDGHHYRNGKVSITTVSSDMAYGVAWLALRLGYFPSLYVSKMPAKGKVQGRIVRRSPNQFTVVWYPQTDIQRRLVEVGDFYLVPIRDIQTKEYTGDVYNLEVEHEHHYLAGFFAVSNCQNWLTSQAMRDPASDVSAEFIRQVTPEQIVQLAKRSGASVIASSYNEPLITAEWAVGIFKQAQQAGLKCVFISNGNATPEALRYLRPYLSAYKIDLKTMQDKHYRQLGGVLQNVLDSIRLARELGLWVEIVTLVVPGFNDSSEELMDAARFIRDVSPDIPWHVTAFHPDYKMTDPPPTSVATLIRAAEIGEEAGLNFVYAGNIPGRTKGYENTYCPKCRQLLVERYGYTIQGYHITAQGTCPKCGAGVPGIWTERPDAVNLDGWGLPRLVRF